MKLPIYIKPDVPFKDAPKASMFTEAGEKIESGELTISLRPNGGAQINFEDDVATFSHGFWENVQASEDYCIKVLYIDGRLRAIKRKFVFIDEENEVETPIEDIEIETTRLENITFDPRLFMPIKTGKYMDEFWSRSKGLLPATNIMITGDPGIGKSSNLMDMLVCIHREDPNKRVLYISAEMAQIDVQEFLQFYPGLEKVDFLFLGDYVTDPNQKIKPYQALQATLEQGWDVVVIDSLYETQSMIQEDLDISSFKKGERYMLDLMNKHNKGHNKANIYTAFLAIQQKNKSGQYVGSKRLEHMTTGFLQLLWDPKEKGKRYMIFEKNRKGKEKVKLYYNLDKNKGIVYDEIRHRKELELIEIIQQGGMDSLETLDDVSFESIFAAKKPDAAHAN